MKQTIYLHVGPHKTGTTVIQKASLDSQELLNENNLSYPQLFFNHLGHHDLVNIVRRRAIHNDDIERLKESQRNILLSSENFIHFTDQDYTYLCSRLGEDFDIKVIYAWRRSSLKMYSLWQESVKHGGYEPFHSYFYNDLIRPGQSKTLMQSIILDMLSKHFGRENLYVLDYDSLAKSGELVNTFFGIMGISPGAIDVSNQGDGVKNRSLDPETTEIIRCLNVLSRKYQLPQSSKARENFYNHQNDIQELIKKVHCLMVDEQNSTESGDYFIDRLCEKSVVEKYSDRILSYVPVNNKKDIKTISPDWLLHSEASSLIQEIYNIVMERDTL